MRAVKPHSAPEVVCVTGLPARTAKSSCRLFLRRNWPIARCHPRSSSSTIGRQELPPMKTSSKRPWFLGIAVAAFTAASYAQWSNPAQDVPAYHPSAPLHVSALPPILSGSKLPARTSATPGRPTSMKRLQRWGTCYTSFPAIAAAISPLAIPACEAALRGCTEPSARPAPKRACTPMRRQSWAGPRRRSGQESPGTTTNLSTSKSNNSPVPS